MQDALGSDIRIECPLRLPGEKLSPGRLANVATGKPENLFQQGSVPFPATIPQSQIVLNDSLDDSFIQLISKVGPIHVSPLVHERVTAAFGEPPESFISGLRLIAAVFSKIEPELAPRERLQPIIVKKGRPQTNPSK
jgi:hypothetical protein